MSQSSQTNESNWLVWVYPEKISQSLIAAPRLEVTKEMRKLGWKVDLIASGPDGTHHEQGVDVLCLTSPDVYFVRHLFFHMRIIRYILRYWKQIDIVLFTQISALWLFPLRVLGLLNKRHPLFVMDTRTVPMESMERSTFKDKLRGRFYYLMNGLANRLADGQTAITQRMADTLHIPTKQLWGTWASGVNLEKFSVLRQHRRWPTAHDPVQLIYIGSLHHERNIMAFSRAVMEAIRQGMNFSFLVYGEGPERPELETFACQTQGRMKVFGSVPHDRVPEILAGAHVGVLPFPDEEKYRVSSPLKLFEYMGSGLTILATKIVCHTDVMGDSDYVFWAEDSDLDGMLKALEKIWQQRSRLQHLSEKAVVAAQEWTYIASAKQLHQALQHGLSLKRSWEAKDRAPLLYSKDG
jgi:glycosyltransferase involved in cell wall biosynthesis